MSWSDLATLWLRASRLHQVAVANAAIRLRSFGGFEKNNGNESLYGAYPEGTFVDTLTED